MEFGVFGESFSVIRQQGMQIAWSVGEWKYTVFAFNLKNKYMSSNVGVYVMTS